MADIAVIEKTLERIGLSANEAGIYIALLKEGPSKAGALSKTAQINRTSTYDALKRLLEKGLVKYRIEANRKLFEAENPERLVDFLKELEEDARELLPKLKTILKEPKEKREVTLYYGYKGMRSVFQEILKEGKPNCVLDTEERPFSLRMPYYAPHFARGVEEKKITIRHLANPGVEVKPTKTTEVRYFRTRRGGKVVVNICGNTVSILIWTEPPEAVVIKNPAVADAFRNYFEFLWKGAKKTYP